ncbi:DUF3368 domain-containing protein [Palaeococcus ferrophilus]|uniref:DUF3368 domain-containing protein n=1 Tax=Palaeococcus ferrophilus TaxID=83868 RepID=UPI00064F3F72|nr:DUF3368 domain-containing protein [Palaeococcus ferrophilus]
MKVVSNTSPLIGLSNIDRLELLKDVFGEIFIPPAVAKEFGEPLPDWIHLKEPKDRPLVKTLMKLLGAGEAEAIALAIEMRADFLILDDLKARKISRDIGIRIIGTGGVILLAKKRKAIGSVKPLLEELSGKGFRLSDGVIRTILEAAGED